METSAPWARPAAEPEDDDDEEVETPATRQMREFMRQSIEEHDAAVADEEKRSRR